MAQIITRIKENLHTCWQKELANVVTAPEKLLEMLNISPADYLEHNKARALFPVRVPRPFIERMELSNPRDPLLLQVMPHSDEFKEMPGFVNDPLGEHDTVAEGLLHKYKHRVLMIVKAGCAVNCRYCFRRHFPYQDNSPNKQRWQHAINYIKQNVEINEVIFSGGDPLMANDQHLAWLIGEIEAIKHIKRLRIHTRFPVVIPQRITNEFCQLLKKSRLKVVMVWHINHANEIDQAIISAVKKLATAGVTQFNQSVLLKDINDSANIQIALCEALFDAGILPYYLHVLDYVQGAAHFDVAENKAIDIAKQMMAVLPGFLMPKVVREIAGETNKTPLNLT